MLLVQNGNLIYEEPPLLFGGSSRVRWMVQPVPSWGCFPITPNETQVVFFRFHETILRWVIGSLGTEERVFKIIVYFPPYLGKWSHLTSIFHQIWLVQNHQLLVENLPWVFNSAHAVRKPRIYWHLSGAEGTSKTLEMPPSSYVVAMGFSRVTQTKKSEMNFPLN